MSRHEAHAMETRQAENAGEPPLAGVLSWINEVYCGLHGHDNLLQFESDRMFLKCASCGHESPGWEISEPAPVERVASATEQVASDHRHRALVRVRLVGSRRVA